MADRVPPTSKVNVTIEKTTFTLHQVCHRLRHGIKIRNRSSMKRLQRNCFVGSEAVSWCTAHLGLSRQGSVRLCKELMQYHFIRHVSDSAKFKDANLYYRFYQDEDTQGARLNEVTFDPATHVPVPSYSPEAANKPWEFAPHTTHNSMVLDLSLAEAVEQAFHSNNEEKQAQALKKLRAKILSQMSSDSPEWDTVKTATINGKESRVWTRVRPRGDFNNIKTEGIIGKSPHDFLIGFLHDQRNQWDSSKSSQSDHTVVAALRHETIPAPVAEGAAEEMEVPESPMAEEDAFATPKKERFTKLPPPPDWPVDLSRCPEDTSIANLGDPNYQNTIDALKGMHHEADLEECSACRSAFKGKEDMHDCPVCGFIRCSLCCSKRVFEVNQQQEIRVCLHCYHESSRIRHPVQHSFSKGMRTGGSQWMSMPEIKAFLEAEAQEEDKHSTIDEEPENFEEDEEDNDEEDAVAQHADIRESDAAPPPPPPPLTTSMEKELQDKLAIEQQQQQQPVSAVAAPVADVMKFAICKYCGARVGRTMEEMDSHECAESSTAALQTLSVATTSATHLGGVPRLTSLPTEEAKRLTSATTRIIFRTHRGELFRPRQSCTFQDAFVVQDGTHVVYEISVRHRSVRTEVNHVTAEILLLAYAAKPIPSMDDASMLTVISQVDDRSRSKWLMGIFSSDDRVGGLNLLRELAASATGFSVKAQNMLGTGEEGKTAEKKVNVTLDDFELLTVLGRGGFGKVMQVRHKKTGNVYAMKIFKKTELRRRRQVERTRTERDIMSRVKHPFIVQLSFAFQTAHKLYMVMDFVQGGDFFTFMRKVGKVREPWARLYITEISMALQHLHDLDIVYRDLKPENVLMDATGHVKLTDFGLSRNFENRPALSQDGSKQNDETALNDFITRSYCGTEQYMAPEMLLQRGHTRVVDWWCLGLLMHEMMTGRHPFHGGTHYDTLRAMVTSEPLIDARVSPAARALIRRLLIKDPSRRLGAQRGAWIELRPHPFFNGLDWDAVLKREVPAPYTPKVHGEDDTENFEDIFTREAPVDSVVEQQGRTGGLFGGLFGQKKKQVKDSDEDPEFAGFSYEAAE